MEIYKAEAKKELLRHFDSLVMTSINCESIIITPRIINHDNQFEALGYDCSSYPKINMDSSKIAIQYSLLSKYFNFKFVFTVSVERDLTCTFYSHNFDSLPSCIKIGVDCNFISIDSAIQIGKKLINGGTLDYTLFSFNKEDLRYYWKLFSHKQLNTKSVLRTVILIDALSGKSKILLIK